MVDLAHTVRILAHKVFKNTVSTQNRAVHKFNKKVTETIAFFSTSIKYLHEYTWHFPIEHIPFQTPLSISGSSRKLVALDLDLSAFCLVAHKASTERLHPSLFAATILASSHDLHLLSYLSFSIVLLHGGSGSTSPYSAFRCPGNVYATIIVVVFS